MGVWDTEPAALGEASGEASGLPDGIAVEEWERITNIYNDIDTDESGSLDAWEIRAAVGGNAVLTLFYGCLNADLTPI